MNGYIYIRLTFIFFRFLSFNSLKYFDIFLLKINYM